MTSSYSCGIAHSGTSSRSIIFRNPVQVLRGGDWKITIDGGEPEATNRELEKIYKALGISERSNSTGIASRSNNPEIDVGLVDTASTTEGREEDGSRVYTLEVPLIGRKVKFRTYPTRGSAHGVFRTVEEMREAGTECDVVYGTFLISKPNESGTGGSHQPAVTIGDSSMASQHGTRASTVD